MNDDEENEREELARRLSSSEGESPLPSATVGGDREGKEKVKCRIHVTYKDKTQNICWYGEETASHNIKDVIRTAFGLPHNTNLLLKNSEGDIVAVSPSLPPNELFTLQVKDEDDEDEEDEGAESREDEEMNEIKHEIDDAQGSESSGTPSSPPSHITPIQEGDSPIITPIKVFDISPPQSC